MSDIKEYERLLKEDVPEQTISTPKGKLGKYRYIACAYYPRLTGISRCRILGYNKKQELLDYLGGLNMCETPHQVVDQKLGKVILKSFYGADEAVIQDIIKENFGRYLDYALSN